MERKVIFMLHRAENGVATEKMWLRLIKLGHVAIMSDGRRVLKLSALEPLWAWRREHKDDFSIKRGEA